MSLSYKNAGEWTTFACPSKRPRRKSEKRALEKERKMREEQQKREMEATDTATSTETSSETSEEVGGGGVVGNTSNEFVNNPNVQNDQTADNQMEGVSEKYTPEFLDAPAKLKWNRVEMIGQCTITKDEYLKQISTTGQTTIEFSVANKRLTFGERDNAPDFTHTKASGKTNRKINASTTHDIVGTMDLKEFTSNGLDNHITNISVNVERHANEGFIGEGDHVCKTLMPQQIRRIMKTGENFRLVHRTPTNSVMLFQNDHIGKTYKNVANDTKSIGQGKYTIPLNGPVITVFNAMNPDREITQPSKSLKKQGLVIVSETMIKKYQPLTINAMKNAISYADITSPEGPVVTFAAPIPESRLADHKLFISSKGSEGRPWLGFFDNHPEESLSIHFRLLSDYVKGGKELQLNL